MINISDIIYHKNPLHAIHNLFIICLIFKGRKNVVTFAIPIEEKPNIRNYHKVIKEYNKTETFHHCSE